MIRRNLRSRNSNKKLYETIMKDVSKTVKRNLNEMDKNTLVTKYKLINFVQGNSEKCKDFVRRCSKDFIDKFNITSYDDFSNINPRLLKNILDKHAKNIFKCGFNSLDKKYANGLSDELIRYSMKFAVKNITQDTQDDWAPMYNINESQDTRLYESIMRDVARTVKRGLNESYKQSTAEILIDKIIDALTEDGTLESIAEGIEFGEYNIDEKYFDEDFCNELGHAVLKEIKNIQYNLDD